MKTFSREEIETITSALQKWLDYLHQQKTLTEQVGGLLDLLIPGDGHRLFTLGNGTAHQLLSTKFSNG